MRNKYLLSILLGLLYLPIFSQVLITGILTDPEGNDLPGVNVVAVEDQIGTTTDEKGVYVIEVRSGSTLEFSMVGFQPVRQKVWKRGILDVRMKEGVELKEVVVTALAIDKEKDALSYTHETIDAAPMTLARENNFGDALVGRIPGVNVSNISSGPAGSTRIVIRGYSSISRDNQPLIVVDGIPMDNSNFGNANEWGGRDWGDGLSSLNPDDIESIAVLKSNAAAALYGSKASNGVLLITTKKGTTGKGIKVELNSNFTVEQPIKYWDFQQQYGQGFDGARPQDQEQAFNTNWQSWGDQLYGQPTIQRDGEIRPYQAVTDNFNRFYENGYTWNNSLALSGGSEKLHGRFGFSHLDNEYVVPNTDFNRKTFTLSAGGKLSKQLNFEAVARYVNDASQNRPRLSDSPGNPNFAIGALPINVPVQSLLGPNRDGSMGTGEEEMQMNANPWITNPYWATHRFHSEDQRNRFIGSVTVNLDLNWMYAQGRIGTDFYSKTMQEIQPQGTAFSNEGKISQQNIQSRNVDAQFILGTKNRFSSGFGYDLFVGTNRFDNRYESSLISGENFQYKGVESVETTSNKSSRYGLWRQRTNALFGSLNLSWKNWLYLNFTGRNDWFSTLPIDNNNLFYPSAGISVLPSEILNLPEWISYAKIHAAWAKVSSDASPYSLDLTYQLTGDNFLGSRPLGVISNYTLPNTNLTPSTSQETEVGLELSLFKKRAGLKLAYYQQETANDIITATISNTSGFEAAFLNEGSIKNNGVEIALSLTPLLSQNFEWTLTGNVAKNNNEVVDLGSGNDEINIANSRSFRASIHHEVGYPASIIKGFTYERDENGNIVHGADGQPLRGDYTYIGNGIHDLIGGINNHVRWKNISLNTLIDFKFGGNIYVGTDYYAYRYGLHKNTLAGRENPLVSEGVNESGEQNQVSIPVDMIAGFYNTLAKSNAEIFVEDADFIKLRQLSLTFDLPDTWLTKWPVSKMSWSLVGRNLAILHRKTTNIDPESTYSNSNAQGLELFGAPRTRSFGMDLRILF